MSEREWHSLDEGRECYDHPLGFKVIRPKESPDPVPLLCPVCSCPMLTADDSHMFVKYQCCASCSLRWVDIRRDEWLDGWRPSDDELSAELSRRRVRAKKIIF